MRQAGGHSAGRAEDGDVAASSRSLYLVDLSLPGLDLASFTAELTSLAADRERRLAVGPHVHRDKLQRARELGWEVMTRGQFHAAADQLFRDVFRTP